MKTEFSRDELSKILSDYTLGELIKVEPFTGGSVQTNYLLQTSKGKFVFRYYENRPLKSVLFEVNLIRFLKGKNYSCPAIFKDKHGKYAGSYNQKPYALFEFVEGQHLENPDEDQKKQLIEKVAELQNLTRNYRPRHNEVRYNYSVKLCRELARTEAEKLNTDNARAKLKWLEDKLAELQLPRTLPKGICHADFHFSNVLFKDGKFNALIDFDDANYTFLMFDMVGLISSWAWRYQEDEVLNFEEARKVVAEYTRYRPLNALEKRHLFDLYKLSILIDCVWYFWRGAAADFFEKRKIEFLDSVGREEFYNKLFV